MKYAILGIKALLTLAFVAAGAAKLAGVEMMVGTFDAIGIGQWFRYVTGILEIGAAALLWARGREAIGAGLLVATMIGAVLAHLVVLGPSAVPAIILGVLAAVILWTHRQQLRTA
jgi:hypothetical protein